MLIPPLASISLPDSLGSARLPPNAPKVPTLIPLLVHFRGLGPLSASLGNGQHPQQTLQWIADIAAGSRRYATQSPSQLGPTDSFPAGMIMGLGLFSSAHWGFAAGELSVQGPSPSVHGMPICKWLSISKSQNVVLSCEGGWTIHDDHFFVTGAILLRCFDSLLSRLLESHVEPKKKASRLLDNTKKKLA